MQPQNPSDETRKRALFDAAAELPEEQRAGFVLNSTRDAPQLGKAVLELLSGMKDTTSGVLDRPIHSRQDREAAIPRAIGKYEVIRQIGSGGMGTVYACRDEKGGTVAVKVVRSIIDGPSAREHFEGERQILAGLRHPNVCQLLDAGVSQGGTPFIVMEFIEGEPLDAFVRRFNPGLERRLLILSQALAGVEYFHRRNIIHRDLKPSNMLVSEKGLLRILDFGTAKMLERPRGATGIGFTMTSRPFLSFRYSSPERLTGRVSGRSSDIYSLGVIGFELAVGHHPFEAECRDGIQSLIKAQAAGLPAVPRNLPEAVRNTVLNALIADPAGRYASAAMFLEDVGRCLERSPVEPRFPAHMIRFQGL